MEKGEQVENHIVLEAVEVDFTPMEESILIVMVDVIGDVGDSRI